MGTTLTGKRVQNTYDSLLKLSDNDNLTGVAKIVGDGLGNDSPIYLSTSKIGIGVSPTYQFQTSGDGKIGGSLIVAGNLTVNGTTTIVDSTIVAIGDNMIEMAKDNTANTMDIGWYGTIVESGTKYVGTYYDASSGITTPTFYIGLGTTEPSSTASWTVKGKLVIGDLSANGGDFTDAVYIDDHLEIENSDGYGYIELGGSSGGYIDLKGPFSNDFDLRIFTGGVNSQINAISGSLDITANSGIDLQYQGSNKLTVISTGIDITGNLFVSGGFKDSDEELGTSGQVLSSTGTGTDWVDFDADSAKALEIDVKNVFGATMTKGTVVHAQPTGTLSGNVIEVVKADANVAANMPAIGVLNEDLNDDEEGKAVMFGTVQGIDTLSFSVGDELYVSTTAGAFTNTKPTATTEQVQKIAVVVKSHASNGLIKVFGAGRSNDVPNLIERSVAFDGGNLSFGDDDTIFFGDNQDFNIQSNGVNTFLSNLNNNLVIQNSADDKDIIFRSDNGDGTTVSNYLVIDGSTGGVNLYHYGTKKFETTSYGALISGQLISEHTSADIPLGATTANLYIKDDRAIAADVGGSIVFSGKYSGSTYLSGGPYIKGYKLNANSGDYSFGLKFGIRKNGAGVSGPVLTLDPDSNATFTGDIFGNLIELEGVGFKGGEGDVLDDSDFNESGVGNTFRWVHKDSSTSGSTWQKVADVTLDLFLPNGCSMDVKVILPNDENGNSASQETLFYSVSFRGADSDTVLYGDAIVYGPDDGKLRVYKSATRTYELQARTEDNDRSIIVEYTITSKYNAKVILTESITAGTTSGGTAYTATQNNNNKTKFAGELDFLGVTIGDDLRINGNLFFGPGADTTYGGFITQYGSSDHGVSITVEDTDGFVINTVYGNAGEAYQAFSITDTIELKDSNETLLEVSLNKIDISAPTEINIGETEVGLAVYTTNVSTTPNVKFGRNANEYIGFSVNDRYNEIIFRQDETTGNASAILDIWSSTTGNVDFTIRKSNSTGGSSSNWMVIQDGDATFTGNVTVGDGTDISMDASANGQLMIDGNGYQGAIAVGSSSMAIYHNSSSRDLVLGTNETARLTINGSDGYSIFSNKIGLNGATPAYTIDTSETTVGTLRMVGDTGHTFIRLGAGGGGNDVTLIRIDGETNNNHGETDSGAYGFSLKYLGSLSGNENALALYADNEAAASQVESFRVKQDGTLDMGGSSIFTQFIKSNSSFRIDIDNDNNQTDRIFIVSKHNSGTELFRVDEFGKGTFDSDVISGQNVLVGQSNSTDNYVKIFHSDDTYTELHGYGLLFNRTSSYIRPINDNTQNMYFGYDPGNLSWNDINFDFSNNVYFKYDATRIFRIKNGGVDITGSVAYLTIDGSSEGGWEIYSPSNAYVHMDVRNFDSDSAMMHKYARNSANNGYRAYYENWYDGSSYHRIGAVDDGFEMLGSLELKKANAQLQLTDTDDSTFSEFSSSGNLLAIRQNSTSANHLWLNSGGKLGIGRQPVSQLHLRYSGGTYSNDSLSGFINEALTGRATKRLRSITDNPAELFFDVNGAIRWDISCRDSGGGNTLNFYPQAATPSLTSVGSHTFELQQDGDVVVKYGHLGIGVDSPSNALDIDSSDTNSVKIRGTGSYNLFSYHDSGGVGWATGSGASYDTLIYMQGQSDRIMFYTGQARRCFINENGQWVIDSTTAIASASANAKLIVGGVMSQGSSAIIQANGFMRLKDYVIIHSATTTSYAGLFRYTNDGAFYTIEGGGKNHFTIGTTSTAYLNGISGTQTTLKVANSNVACLLLHSTATNGVPWQNYSSSNGTLNWYNDNINLNALAISHFDGSTASSNAFNSTELRLHSGAKTGWGSGDVLGQISFYSVDGSGVGARDAVFLKATNLQGNGSSTTTFEGNLEVHTSSYNASAGLCATFTAGKGLDVVGPIVMTGGNGNYSAGIDTETDAGFIMQQGHKFYSLANSDNYLRNLIEHNSSNDIIIGQGGTGLIRDINLITGTSGTINFFTNNSSSTRFKMYSNGDFHADGDIVAYSTSISDAKLKDNVKTIDHALDKVNNLRGVEYIWNYGTRKDQKDLGVIAQEVEQVLPEIVREKEMMDGDKYKTVDYEKLTAVLIESVKELSAKVEALENKKCNCNCK